MPVTEGECVLCGGTFPIGKHGVVKHGVVGLERVPCSGSGRAPYLWSPAACAADGCDRPPEKGGRCRPHYRRWKAATIAADPHVAPHGEWRTYSNWSCRCDPCKAAWSEKNRTGWSDQKRRRRQRQANPVRSAEVCINGHPYDDENTGRGRRGDRFVRVCKQCHREGKWRRECNGDEEAVAVRRMNYELWRLEEIRARLSGEAHAPRSGGLCSAEDCDRESRQRGMCWRHYGQWYMAQPDKRARATALARERARARRSAR